MLIRITLLLLLALPAPARGKTLNEQASAIDSKLMAPCCWSSTVSQHYSQAADDIRRGVREMLDAGKSEQEILDYYVSVYGERILASPPAHGFNLLVWVLPGIFFIASSVFLILLFRSWMASRPAPAVVELPGAQLDERYQRRLEKELNDLK
jgi:cytochrome c-type biogenesis protein CcmH